MTTLEQKFYQCEIGTDYPHPIIDIQKIYQNVYQKLRDLRRDEEVKQEKS